jgi:hypothetical protein
MLTATPTPPERTVFNGAMDALRADHATLRHLAECASRAGFPADDVLSLADAMATHERAEAALFSLPFLARTPETVSASAARTHRLCHEYLTGDFELPDPGSAAARFVEALLDHLAVEDAWLAQQRELKNERMWTAI